MKHFCLFFKQIGTESCLFFKQIGTESCLFFEQILADYCPFFGQKIDQITAATYPQIATCGRCVAATSSATCHTTPLGVWRVAKWCGTKMGVAG